MSCLKSKVKKVFAISMVVTMGLLFSACGSNKKSSEASKDKDGNTELKIFIDPTYWPLTDWKGKIPEKITEETGVKLKVQVATDAQQLPLMIASGDLPDLVFTQDHFSDLSDSKMSYNIDELFKESKVKEPKIDNLSRVLNNGKDGKLYSIKNGLTSNEVFKKVDKALPNLPYLSIRSDMLEEQGNPDIDTLDKLVLFLETAKKNHPDSIPLVMDPDAVGKYFRVNLGASYLHNFQEVDGKVKYYIEQPEQKDYYLFMNELYRKGLITAENYTWDKGDKANSKIIDGSAVAINNLYDYTSINTNIKNNDKKYELIPMTKVLGKNARSSVNSVGWAGLFVTKNCKNTKAAAKFLKYMMSDEGQKLGLWGIEGEDYEMQDGDDIYKGAYPKFNYDSQNTDEQKKNGSVWWGLLADKGEYEAVQRYVEGTKLTEFETNYKSIVENDPMLGAITFKSNSDEQVIQGNIDELITREESKIYLATSASEAEKAYNSMIKKIDELNINKIDTAAQKQIDKLQNEYDKLK